MIRFDLVVKKAFVVRLHYASLLCNLGCLLQLLPLAEELLAIHMFKCVYVFCVVLWRRRLARPPSAAQRLACPSPAAPRGAAVLKAAPRAILPRAVPRRACRARLASFLRAATTRPTLRRRAVF